MEIGGDYMFDRQAIWYAEAQYGQVNVCRHQVAIFRVEKRRFRNSNCVLEH